MRDKALYLWQKLDEIDTILCDLCGKDWLTSHAKGAIQRVVKEALATVRFGSVYKSRDKHLWINHTRRDRALRMINYKMSFILAAFDDDEPGDAAAPEPIAPDGFDGIILGSPDAVSLLAMTVLA